MNRTRPLALIAAGLLVLGACGSGDDQVSTPAASGDLTTASEAVRPSVTPDLTPVDELEVAEASEEHVSYAPEVPAPVSRRDQRIFEVHLEAFETDACALDPASGVETEMWGFRINGDADVTCGAPGPVLRGRVGDLARITLTNDASSTEPHNIDFHAVTGQGGGAADLTVAPGETKTIDVRLLYPGAFMYHCAFGDVPMHIAHGMYGMFIVDPETPLPAVDHEWAVMQSEWYVGDADADGFAPFDKGALLDEEPAYVTFNGRTDALTGDNALHMQVGERARIYMVNEGLSLDSNFHPIGSHWDVVYPEAATHPTNDPIRGSQSTLVVAGGGTVTELVGQVPSTILLVDHALGRTFYKGAKGEIVVEGDENPEIYGTGTPPDEDAASTAGAGSDETTTTTEPDGGGSAAVSTSEVVIPQDAFDPSNADNAYDPLDITVPVGTTVTWTNRDAIAHTVTSGTSDGSTGDADGRFDSGSIATGETFSFTFDETGTFPYFCTPHPWMRGTVTVE